MNDALLLSLLLYGLAILISLGVALLVRLLVLALGRGGAKAEPTPRPLAQTPPAEHVAAISAALAVMLGPHRIVHISERQHVEGWAQEGRAAHHQSHNLPRRPRR